MWWVRLGQSEATQSTTTNTITTSPITTEQQQQRTSRKLKAKLERKRSPYWSSEEESSSAASRPDTGSSSSDDTNEQQTKQQLHQHHMHKGNSRNGRYNRVSVRAPPRFNPPIGQEIFNDDDDSSSVLEDDNSDRKLPKLPDLFFSQKKKVVRNPLPPCHCPPPILKYVNDWIWNMSGHWKNEKSDTMLVTNQSDNQQRSL
ncbi:hypothetical protein MHU86_16989 [Fragilaria crotonensis]|nr:hypothetical protein MHU86_16989 [Fragilaria crotonensis]